jgi:hypothetical protein
MLISANQNVVFHVVQGIYTSLVTLLLNAFQKPFARNSSKEPASAIFSTVLRAGIAPVAIDTNSLTEYDAIIA